MLLSYFYHFFGQIQHSYYLSTAVANGNSDFGDVIPKSNRRSTYELTNKWLNYLTGYYTDCDLADLCGDTSGHYDSCDDLGPTTSKSSQSRHPSRA